MADSGDKTQPTVVMAIDASKQAEYALDYYLDNLHKPGNRMVLVHIIELPDLANSRQVYLSPAGLAEVWKEEEHRAAELQNKFKKKLQDREVTGAKIRTDGGLKPGAVICQVADEEGATMIVMGTRGMGKIRRTIMGSVSDYVVHHAKCPVVVCRRQQ